MRDYVGIPVLLQAMVWQVNLMRNEVRDHVGAFQLEMSVDQDLAVVAEAIDDDCRQAMACPNCFHARA